MKGPDESIRVWSSGCASGEEAYSTAMLLCEALGSDRFEKQVKIFATDVDEEALSKARLAAYNEKEMEGVPDSLCTRYFVRNEDTYTFHKELRHSIIFGRNDLVQNAPISRAETL